MSTQTAALSLLALDSDSTAQDMRRIIRDHDASLANLQKQKAIHPTVALIDEMIALVTRYRAFAVDLLHAPAHLRHVLAKTSPAETTRV